MVAFFFFPSFLCFGFDDILFLKRHLEEFFTSLMIPTILILTRKNLRSQALYYYYNARQNERVKLLAGTELRVHSSFHLFR